MVKNPLVSMSEGQKWYQELKLRLQPKTLLQTKLNTLIDKTMQFAELFQS